MLFSFFGNTMATEYTAGQIWSYKTRTGEESSTILINKIQNDPKIGKIFHISVRDVNVINPHAQAGVSKDLPHFPVSEITLEKSCLKITGQSAINPEFNEGYKIWRKAFDAGEAGVFDISVAEIVDFIQQTVAN
jgi:hypothetical protein